MPYTRQLERTPFTRSVKEIVENINGAGDLTYVVCMIMWGLWKKNGASFTYWGTLRSSVEEAVSDFRDRHISVLNPDGYEAKKLKENGDVYL